MADSLLQTVKQNGQLMQVAKPDVASLTAASGAKQPPANPLGAAVLGATPNAAAAMGTANGVQSAVNAMRLNARGTNGQGQARDLSTALREQQASGQQTPAQAAATAAAQGLAPGANSLQANVSKIVEQDYSAAAAAASNPVNLTVNLAKIPAQLQGNVAPGDFTTALATLGGQNQDGSQSTPAQQDAALATVLNGLGGANAASGLLGGQAATVANLSQYFNDTGTILANTIQGKLPTDVTVGQLQPANLGVQSFSELDTLLGVQPGTTAGMTIAQFTSAVQAKQAGSYNTAAQWESILTNPTSSNALRATATQMLQGMGVTGALSAEKSVANLTNQVQAANQITFQGQTMTTAQALSSTVVQGTIATYLAGVGPNATPEAAAASAAMKADPSMAGFTSWIDANSAELATATANIGVDAQADAAATTATNGVFSFLGPSGNSVLTGIQQALTGQAAGSVYSTAFVPQAGSTLAAIGSMDAVGQTNANTVLAGIFGNSGPNGGATNAAAFAQLPAAASGWIFADTTGATAQAFVDKLNLQTASPASIPGLIYGSGGAAAAQAQVSTAAFMTAAGVNLSAGTQAALSAVSSGGKLLSNSQLVTNVQTDNPPQTIAQMVDAGFVAPSLTDDVGGMEQDVSKAISSMPAGVNQDIAQNMAGNNGVLNAPALVTSLGTVAASSGNFTDLNTLSSTLASQGAVMGLTPAQVKAAQASITSAQTNATNSITDSLLAAAGAGSYSANMSVLQTSTVNDASSIPNLTNLITQANQALQNAVAHQMDPSITTKIEDVLNLASTRLQIVQDQDAAAAAAAPNTNKGSGVSQVKAGYAAAPQKIASSAPVLAAKKIAELPYQGPVSLASTVGSAIKKVGI